MKTTNGTLIAVGAATLALTCPVALAQTTTDAVQSNTSSVAPDTDTDHDDGEEGRWGLLGLLGLAGLLGLKRRDHNGTRDTTR